MEKEIIGNAILYRGDCLEILQDNILQNSIDLTVTSPPYDNLRAYKGYSFKFEETAKELFRVTKDNRVIAWIVNDSTIKGDESGTSFKQALYFKSIGFKLYDTMIYAKAQPLVKNHRRYESAFEYMFILSKGIPETVNLIREKNNPEHFRTNRHGNVRQFDGSTIRKAMPNSLTKIKKNIWEYHVGFMHTTTDAMAYKHPAMFPEKLAQDHIWSWSNKKDVVFDPFMGSGTTGKMAIKNGRKFIGCEVSTEYFDIACKRIEIEQSQIPLDI